MPKSPLVALLLSLAVCLPASMLLLLLAPILLTHLTHPAPYLPLCAYAILLLGAAASALIAVRLHRSRGVLLGSATAGSYFALLLLVGLCLGVKSLSTVLLLLAACLLLGMLCGYLALPRTASNPARTARRRLAAHRPALPR